MNKNNSIECNSIEAIDKTDLSEQTKFRLDEISKIENYFIEEINQRKLCSKKICKYAAVDNILIALSAATGGVSVCSFTNIVGAPVVISSASFTLFFSLTTGITKILLNITRKKRKKHDKIHMLAKSKLSSIETLIPQALIDMNVSPEKFGTVLDEKDKYEKIKDNLRNDNEKSYEIMRLSSVKSNT